MWSPFWWDDQNYCSQLHIIDGLESAVAFSDLWDVTIFWDLQDDDDGFDVEAGLNELQGSLTKKQYG